MTMRNALLGAGLAVAATVSLGGAAQASVITINMGLTAENFTLYGMGETFAGSQVGTYTVGQGSSTYDGTTSTFTMSGAITGGNTAGLNSGTYQFVTTYLGPDSPTAGPNAPKAVANAPNSNSFVYSFLDPSTNMTLFIQTPNGNFSEALVTNGVFQAGFGFSYANTVCTGLGVNPCSQALVGNTPGATITGHITGQVSLNSDTLNGGVPEPASWALMLLGFGGLGAALRQRRRAALAA